MQDSDLPDLWTELPAQLAAIVCVIGTTLGALRANGILTAEDTSDIFTLADHLLPEHAGTHVVYDIGGNRGAGHAENERAGLILCDHMSARFMQRKILDESAAVRKVG